MPSVVTNEHGRHFCCFSLDTKADGKGSYISVTLEALRAIRLSDQFKGNCENKIVILMGVTLSVNQNEFRKSKRKKEIDRANKGTWQNKLLDTRKVSQLKLSSLAKCQNVFLLTRESCRCCGKRETLTKTQIDLENDQNLCYANQESIDTNISLSRCYVVCKTD